MKKNRLGKLRRLLLPLSAILLVSCLVVTVTLALYVDTTEAATNTLTLGDVDISVFEPDGTEYTITETEGVYNAISKSPSVQNDGSVPVYVRIILGGGDNFTFDYDTTNWVQDTNDAHVYYYRHILQPGTESRTLTPLFTSVTPKPNVDVTDLNLIVYAEAVQTWVAGATDAITAFAAIA
ncbi:MAG: hypothetical protein LBN30_06260 [Oscillospiraceae bacterium]|nr:hypothetical protein [Oscillospiraceae bacterium]